MVPHSPPCCGVRGSWGRHRHQSHCSQSGGKINPPFFLRFFLFSCCAVHINPCPSLSLFLPRLHRRHAMVTVCVLCSFLSFSHCRCPCCGHPLPTHINLTQVAPSWPFSLSSPPLFHLPPSLSPTTYRVPSVVPSYVLCVRTAAPPLSPPHISLGPSSLARNLEKNRSSSFSLTFNCTPPATRGDGGERDLAHHIIHISHTSLAKCPDPHPLPLLECWRLSFPLFIGTHAHIPPLPLSLPACVRQGFLPACTHSLSFLFLTLTDSLVLFIPFPFSLSSSSTIGSLPFLPSLLSPFIIF